jgi:hypothetical protein
MAGLPPLPTDKEFRVNSGHPTRMTSPAILGPMAGVMQARDRALKTVFQEFAVVGIAGHVPAIGIVPTAEMPMQCVVDD